MFITQTHLSSCVSRIPANNSTSELGETGTLKHVSIYLSKTCQNFHRLRWMQHLQSRHWHLGRRASEPAEQSIDISLPHRSSMAGLENEEFQGGSYWCLETVIWIVISISFIFTHLFGLGMSWPLMILSQLIHFKTLRLKTALKHTSWNQVQLGQGLKPCESAILFSVFGQDLAANDGNWASNSQGGENPTQLAAIYWFPVSNCFVFFPAMKNPHSMVVSNMLHHRSNHLFYHFNQIKPLFFPVLWKQKFLGTLPGLGDRWP